MKYQLAETKVKTGQSVFIAPDASVIGNVQLGNQASVWFNAVLRGDSDAITIGDRTNIQDGAVLHVDPGYPLMIAEDVTVGHKAMLHGCSIGSGSLIGINAVVLNGAKIGKGCLIGANALVTEGMDIPDGSLVLGSPAKVKKTLSQEQLDGLLQSAKTYVEKAAYYNENLKEDKGS